MTSTISTTIKRLEKVISGLDYDAKRIEELRDKVASETTKLDAFKEARKVCQTVLSLVQNRFQSDIEVLMTDAIKGVFNRFRFELEWREGAARTDMKFNILDGDNVMDLEEDLGCSILDVISLASRPVFHRYQPKQTRNVLFFDEPLKWVGRGVYLDRAAELLRLIADQGYQIIIVTHERKLATIADKTFKVQRINGVSDIREIVVEEVL